MQEGGGGREGGRGAQIASSLVLLFVLVLLLLLQLGRGRDREGLLRETRTRGLA
jgi:hypothetical protein